MNVVHRVTRLLGSAAVVRRKVAERGWRWFLLRLSEQCVDPTTRIGRATLPVITFGRKLGRAPFPRRTADHESAETLLLFYDLQVAPITFNVIDELVAAEMTRRRLGLKGIHVVVVPGRHEGLRWENAEYDEVVNRDTRLWRLHNIVIPSFSLLPTCSGYTVCSSRSQASELLSAHSGPIYPPDYTLALPVRPLRRVMMSMIDAGEAVFPMLEAMPEAKRLVQRKLASLTAGRRAVVITLRNYPFMPQRNSRVENWAAFARKLDPARFVPIIVPDFHVALDPPHAELKDFAHFPEAAINLHIRMALYEQAWLNVAVMHGPMELCWYSESCRYVVFQSIGLAPQTERAQMETEGFDVGGQFPWAKSHQRWVWENDDVDVIQRHFHELERIIETSIGAR